MENLLNPNITCTDPDNLQFCLPISEYEFWYCEPNGYNDLLLSDSNSNESQILEKYLGNPKQLLEDAKIDEAVKSFIANRLLWMSGEVDVRYFTQKEKEELLSDYGYSWEDFDNDIERNQIICENYFESNPMDFRNDI